MPLGHGLRNLDIFNTPIHVINLKERADRWSTFQTENAAALQSVKVQRFNAVNGMKLDYLKDPRISPQTRLNIMRDDRRTHREIATLGAVGASLSHMALWKKLVESDRPYAVIMEDDARFDPAVLNRIKSVAATIPADAGVWLFGLYKPNHHFEPLEPAGKDGTWARVHQFNALHAYAITRDAAKKFLEQALPIEMHIDHYMSVMSTLYDIPMYEHSHVYIPYERIMKTDKKQRARDSNTSQHKKDGCSACHVPDHLHKFYKKVEWVSPAGRLVRGLLKKAPSRKIITYKTAKKTRKNSTA